ncbi:prefoldin alpha subunit [Paragonimus westermani]|uniref:Prefoldin alpha subunit n=1 Tax=Paragonimus westermani TaxID=34504 RepID=A0A5J4NXG0_9TREM|nr:prefoldin alpha subunit [Paragonimus westermani]
MATDTVNITDLSIPQLQELVRQYDQKIQFITTSFQQLKSLQGQFAASRNCLKDFTPDSRDRDILVPLTSTLCVPGKLSDTDHVVIDIGTGYYSEMTIKQAEEHFTRRIEYINKHLQEITPVLEEKSQIHKSISAALESKVQEFVRSRTTASS